MKTFLKSLPLFHKIGFSLLFLIALFLIVFLFSFIDFTSFSIDVLYYSIALFFVLSIFAAFGVRKIAKENSPSKKTKIILFIGILLLVLVFAICTSNYVSGDYYIYLGNWIESYKSLSFSECLNNITTISNYTPVYNYFLIIIAKLGVNSLHAIKFVTFIFSLLLVISMELVIFFVRKSEFNFLRAACFLLVPTICIEYSFWGQCDAIYTAFCILAFYFALVKKSKLSFMFVGIAFVFKFQFLFIVPILFIMLIIKDKTGEKYLKWKDLWIAPIMYALNFVPLFTGASLIDLLSVYFSQAGYYDKLSQSCANFCIIFDVFNIQGGSVPYYIIMILTILITLCLMIALIVYIVKLSKRRILDYSDLVFFATVFSFIMVFFMPKMLDRFYFLASTLGIILACSKPSKSNVYISILIEIALFFVMVLFFNNAYDWVSYVYTPFMVFALVLNIIVLGIMVFELLNYKKSESKTFESEETKMLVGNMKDVI